MLIFADPVYLWFLVLVPLIPLAYGIVRALRRRSVKKLGDPVMVAHLMPSLSGAKGWVRISIFALAFLCFILGMSRPQLGAKLSEIVSELSYRRE